MYICYVVEEWRLSLTCYLDLIKECTTESCVGVHFGTLIIDQQQCWAKDCGVLHQNSCQYTANIYSQFTVIGCVTFPTVIWQWLAQPTAVPTTLSDTEEYSLRSIAILGCNMHSQITVGNVTLSKAVLSTVKNLLCRIYYPFVTDLHYLL